MAVWFVIESTHDGAYLFDLNATDVVGKDVSDLY
jgi:uncharacterized protein YegP (UPF0339 family)